MNGQVYKCAECGHLHFLGSELGYEECPVEGCGCEGQEWAKLLCGHGHEDSDDCDDCHREAARHGGF